MPRRRAVARVLVLAAAVAPGACTRAPAGGPSAAASPSGDVLVVLEKDAARARLVDPGSGATLTTLPTGPFPHEVAVSPDGRTAVVADYGAQTPGRTLTVLDLAGRRVVRTVDLGEYRRLRRR
jgi:DNA-binding beta-propeller fold protein YncE